MVGNWKVFSRRVICSAGQRRPSVQLLSMFGSWGLLNPPLPGVFPKVGTWPRLSRVSASSGCPSRMVFLLEQFWGYCWFHCSFHQRVLVQQELLLGDFTCCCCLTCCIWSFCVTNWEGLSLADDDGWLFHLYDVLKGILKEIWNCQVKKNFPVFLNKVLFRYFDCSRVNC